MQEKAKKGRRKVSVLFLVLLGCAIGFLIKNVKAGLLIGLFIGVLAGSLSRRT